MYVSPKEMLADAREKHYAVAAFNFYNLDTLMAVIEAAEEEKAPVIAQIYAEHFAFYHGGGLIAKAALRIIEETKVPVCLHLDHSDSYERINYAINLGFHSVMYDGSSLPLEENIALAQKVVGQAHSKGIYTEVELGRIGRISGGELDVLYDDCTSVEEAVRLVEESGADSLAPAIGTAHGIYKTTPKLNFERLAEIKDAVNVPLVLHGGSGIPEDMIRKSIELGIAKINVGTELKYKWSSTVKEGLESGIKEPIRLGEDAKTAVKEVAKTKIRLFGSNGRA